MSNRLKAYLTLTFVSLLWGIASPVIKYTLNFIPPYSFLFWRFLLTSLIFLPIFIYFLKKQPIKAKDIPWLIFLGFLSTPLNLILLFVGYEKTTSMDGVLISATAPIFITIAGALFLKEKVTKIERIGLMIAVIGSLITISQPIFEGNLFKGNFYGNFLVFLSVIAWVIYVILYKKRSLKYHPTIPTAIGFFVGLLVVFPFFNHESVARSMQIKLECHQLFEEAERSGIRLWPPAKCANEKFGYYFELFNSFDKIGPGILYMSIFSSFIAYTLYEYGLSLIEASEATLFAYLQPIFAAPIALWWLGEKISLPFILGATVIAIGVFVSEMVK